MNGTVTGAVNGALYEAVVRHERSRPLRYGFGHRTYFWLIDPDDPPRLPWALRPLARFRARDHVGDPGRSLRANLDAVLAEAGVDLGGGRVSMLTQARVLGYVFNPITVYWCHDAAGELVRVVAEVHNTYGGRHTYVLRPDEDGDPRRMITRKEFYVSPFFDVSGDYRMRLPEPGERLHLVIHLVRPDGKAFSASLTGRRRPATTANLLRLSVRHPLGPLVNTIRIRWHGVRLYLRGLPVIPRKAAP
ncbi:DUF1365 domain-containing protein [Hamadaea tsunoensis]|uniref:DUF1365 domain-containing protein n=1 Tax=Hamadaea tsunoensis TaxID=53368 RepID=UPI000401D2EA|nr:DUF1365 domain-containing protein [Hamadaea tsunoensis]